MTQHYATTPFGRRPMTLGQISSRMTVKAMPKEAMAHKWHVFYDIRAARQAVGATDRALSILEALLSFHPETALSGDGDLIVFPSNEQLIARSNGMSPATLRRHLAILVTCGLILRRDSPNGKRFARKGQSGEIQQAYGFDLSPLVARAAEFKALAQAAADEKKALRLAKERITICRRDVVKMIDAGLAESVPADWRGFRQRYDGILARLPRTAGLETLTLIAHDLERLWGEISTLLEAFVKTLNTSANESQTEHHIQNSKPDSSSEPEQGFSIKEEAGGEATATGNVHALPKRDLPLGMVLDACPELGVLATGPIRTWRDFVTAAELARTYVGISVDAWAEARTVMGEEQAAITVAAILQRAEQISSCGGYLRSLTGRAREGQFSVWPMVMALLRAKLDAAKVSRPAAAPETARFGSRGARVDEVLKGLGAGSPRPDAPDGAW